MNECVERERLLRRFNIDDMMNVKENKHTAIKGHYCWRCGARMDGAE